MRVWLKDPITQQPSVSLTLLVVAVTLMLVFIVLEAFEVLQSTNLLDEFFMTSVGLYFGRRVGFRGTTMDSLSKNDNLDVRTPSIRVNETTVVKDITP